MDDIEGDVHGVPQGAYTFVHVYAKNVAEVEKYVPSAVDSVDPTGHF